MPAHRLPGLLVALLCAALVACGPGPSPSPAATPSATPASAPLASPSPQASTDATAVYAAIAAQVEQIRGLQPKGAIAPVLLDAEQLRANLTESFDKDNPAAVVRETETLYQLLGLLPVGASLRSAELNLMAGQVAGYYSPDKKQLFVVSRAGGIGPTQRVTYAHEFTHQLQDQNFDLKQVLGSATDQSDRTLARLSLIEGDAVATQTAWTTANLDAADLAELLKDATDPAVIASLQQAPPILRILSLAPYTEGQAFVAALQAKGGGEASVNAAFGAPPASTSQVIHPELYGEAAKPLDVALPAGLAKALPAGWSSLGQDTLGELFIRSWLQAAGMSATDAAAAAAGWSGDRVEVFAGPAGGAALVLQVRLASTSDGAELGRAWLQVESGVEGVGEVRANGDNTLVQVVIAPTRELAAGLETAAWR